MKRALVLDSEHDGMYRAAPIVDATGEMGRFSPDRSSDIRLFLLAFGAGFLFFSALIA
ncbi:hypothetical protein [Aquisediminimonas sediminicola]|uniref:hypothetical protein n=1 Tax=Alteraquisediminimonas sediminicola TaxID=2676787 RepID=UPI001C8DCEE7|nr:hypothetical protein [Aquisediminimonas sediminicola]